MIGLKKNQEQKLTSKHDLAVQVITEHTWETLNEVGKLVYVTLEELNDVSKHFSDDTPMIDLVRRIIKERKEKGYGENTQSCFFICINNFCK